MKRERVAWCVERQKLCRGPWRPILIYVSSAEALRVGASLDSTSRYHWRYRIRPYAPAPVAPKPGRGKRT